MELKARPSLSDSSERGEEGRRGQRKQRGGEVARGRRSAGDHKAAGAAAAPADAAAAAVAPLLILPCMAARALSNRTCCLRLSSSMLSALCSSLRFPVRLAVRRVAALAATTVPLADIEGE